MKKTKISALKASAAPIVLGLAFVSSAAFAQDKPVDCNANPDDASCKEQVIVVTGSILRRTDTETPSPVTSLSTETLEQRGINTVSEGLQRIAANGSGAMAEGWNNGNNFAAGANAVSLRGLTVQKTLTVFDGLRMAPYPLADDGHRNFVDLNTVPDAIVEKIEVLKDGASSTYGADAVAGVINVITKKQVKGIHANVSAGAIQRGGAKDYRADLTVGFGDLEEQGFNIYVSGTYRKNEAMYARDLEYPFNTGDLSGITDGAGHGMNIGTRWYQFGVNTDGSLGGSTIGNAPDVAPGTTAGARNGVYQLLNPNCAAFGMTPITLPSTAAGTTWNPSQCSLDMRKAYATARPETERYGLSFRATVKVGDKAEFYITGNYLHGHTFTELTPTAFNNATPPPSSVTLNPIVLPVYVCSAGTATFAGTVNVSSGCNASNGVLNPNNPFAASGQVALLRGRYDRPYEIISNNRSLRGAMGISGTFGSDDDWNYQVDFTASEVKATRISNNVLIPQRLADVIANGTYNFVDPSKNSQAVRDYVAPQNTKVSTSQLWQASATLGHTLMQLPGGPLQVAVGAAYRHEEINDASANPDNVAHPFDRYYTINAVGAIGSRNVRSGFYEIGAPIIDKLEINASGRYDSYSSGQKNFSPKFGFKFKPIQQVLLRGTWSKGFRIPSFNEAYGLPTTGYTTLSVNCTTYAAFCNAHGNNSYATGQYSLGRTSVGNPGLAPEKSTSWTLGTVIEPMRNLSFTIDYFNIKVKDVISNIAAADQTAALDAFLKNGTTNAVSGITVVPGTADPQFPNALPLPGFIQFSFQNGAQEEVQGIDFGVDFKHDFGGVRWSSSFEASYLIKYGLTTKAGDFERYDGSLSPCDYTSCSGSPKWRGSWDNTISIGKFSGTATVYYTSGYDLASVDYGGVPGDCAASIGASVVVYKGTSTPVSCHTSATWNVDLSARYKINDHFSLYGTVLNAFNIKAPFDPSAAYSIFQYNPAWAQQNAIGRQFRIGAKVDF